MRWLIALGAASAVLHATALTVPHWGRELERFAPLYSGLIVAYLGLAWRVARPGRTDAGEGRLLAVVWMGAVVFRVLAWMAPPSLSDDIYRHLWDGKVLLAGVNPYRYPPEAPALAPLRDALWAHVNHPSLPTIYPPLLVLVSAAVTAVAPGVAAWKAAMALFDLGAGYALMRALGASGRRPWTVALYLWHPLVVIEFAGSGHADAVGLCLLALGCWAWGSGRHVRAGFGFAAAGLVKFLPWCALPVLAPRLRGRWWLLPAFVALVYAPFFGNGVNALGSLDVFARIWRANDFLFGFLAGEGDPARLARAKIAAGIVAALVWVAAVWRGRSVPSVYGWTAGAALLLSPVVHPWYVIWLLPAALLSGQIAWWAWSLTVFLAYAPLPGYLARGAWEESMFLKGLEMLPVLLLLPVQLLLEMRRVRVPADPSPRPRPASSGS